MSSTSQTIFIPITVEVTNSHQNAGRLRSTRADLRHYLELIMVSNELAFDDEYLKSLTAQLWPILKASIKSRM